MCLQLTIENRHLRQEVEDIYARGGLLEDDNVLKSIEASFRQFHAFLDLLRDAGYALLHISRAKTEWDMFARL